ncbi:hypothetical protein ABZS71_06700 [Streptomyces sp. NPDC005393]|uniref:hypothetical protein n=1 Tax=Streptomyces sp. NPDC005393 TaxID=3157041 RepID=UPI0033A04A46
MFSDFSDRDVSGRTDLQEFPKLSLHDTRRALMAGVPIQECCVHAALVTNPDILGLDAIEARSGLGRMTLLGDPRRGTPGILPAEGQSSTLLYCASRGVFTLEEDERRPMKVEPFGFGSYANWSSADHQSSESSISKKGLETLGEKEEKDLVSGNGPQMTTSGEAPWIQRHEQLLRPDRDIWANRAVGNREALGDAGWAIALVWGFEPVSVPLKDVQRLLDLSPKQTQRVVDKLGFERTSGRGAVVTVDFSRLVHEQAEEEGWYNGPGLRAAQKARKAHDKRKAAGRRRTRHGLAAFRVHEHRELVAQAIEDPQWRRKVLEYSEERLAEALESWVAQHDGELPRWAQAVLCALRAHKDRLDVAATYSDAIAEAETEEHKRDLAKLKARLVDAKPADYVGTWLEPANVPDSPKALVETKESNNASPLPAQPAPGSLDAHEFMALSEAAKQETLAAMRARLGITVTG